MARTAINQHMTGQLVDDYLAVWIDAFITAKRAGGMAKNTVLFYTRKLRQFSDYCDGQQLQRIEQLTPAFLREYLLYLEATNHNAGGRHAAFRAVRAFLYWYESEAEPDASQWSNPIAKVSAPRVPREPLAGVSLAEVLAMVKVCKRGSYAGDRDAAILLCLLDTGCRAREFLAVNVEDVNQATGEILIRQSKGRRPRFVYLATTARKALRRYLKHRTDANPALWLSREKSRLAYESLRGIVIRRATEAGIPAPPLHAFRRGFALMFLKNGGDIFTLARLLGHKDIHVLKFYLAQTDQDIALAHAKFSPLTTR
jgi:integrase/recombinase XerD